MSDDVRKDMESSGWELASEDEPGIYVRRTEVRFSDYIDWTSEPTSLLEELERANPIIGEQLYQRTNPVGQNNAAPAERVSQDYDWNDPSRYKY